LVDPWKSSCCDSFLTKFLTLDVSAAVVKHFDDFNEDQFDFHAYCVRKVTLRAYTEVLRFEDNLWGEDYYFQAASGIIGIYLHLFDNPNLLEDDKEPDYSKLTGAEKKKAKAIARKKRIQAEKKEAEKRQKEAESTENGGQKKKGKTSAVDEDPDGKELLKKNPLEEAKKFSAILSKHCPKRFGTWVLQYDVAVRRNKKLLALQALSRMESLDDKNADYFSRLVDFATKSDGQKDVPAEVQRVTSSEFQKLLNQKPLSEFVSEAAAEARQDKLTALPLRVAIAEAIVKTKSDSLEAATNLILDDGLGGKGVDVDACRSALTTLKGFGSESEKSAKQWVEAVKSRFPLAANFSLG
jgi:hypothetical protein